MRVLRKINENRFTNYFSLPVIKSLNRSNLQEEVSLFLTGGRYVRQEQLFY